ncbi:MAG: type II toxin-antitoxin system VapC family toxin [Bdellovibrio bacteriovorus]
MKGLLLDTHILIWWLCDDGRLPGWARTPLSDPEMPCFVSAATLWEIGIKRALGKLEAPAELASVIGDEGFLGLPISLDHAERAANLPPIHRDPFDRMLIAQALAESLTLVSVDPRFAPYGVDLLHG